MDANRTARTSQMQGPLAVAIACIAFLGLPAGHVLAADWSCYQADATRSGITPEKLAFPLAPAWTYTSSQPPRPAWPDPRKERHRMDFDYGPQPVAAGGLVYFGSSADDTIRALDAVTGRVRWRFTTDGPIRFAPAIYQGRTYVASDDGVLYCLDAATGKVRWTFRGGPKKDRILGNGRMISRWPLRSGVLVDAGVAYVAAGMWPAEGTCIYALDADTGKTKWLNDTSNCFYAAQPHTSAYALTGVAPQGYLVASKDVLLVPTGRAVPATFDRHTGRLLRYRHAYNKRNGGVWAAIDEPKDRFFNGFPGLIFAHRLSQPGGRVASYRAQRVLAAGNALYAATYGAITCSEPQWQTPFPDKAHCLAMAGDALLVGGTYLAAYAGDTGKEIWKTKLQGEVRGIAVADGRLIASTDRGAVYCFAPGAVPRPPAGRQLLGGSTGIGAAAEILELMADSKITKGYALVVGGPDSRLAEALASNTDLHVINLFRDEAKVKQERERLLDTTGLLGSRVAIHHVADPKQLTCSSYFANLVIVSGNGDGIAGQELYRVLRPCGGVMCFPGQALADASKLVANAGLLAGQPRPWRSSAVVVRGKLPGAFDWDSKVTCDERVRWPIELLWFGGPGPSRMVDRHWRAPTPRPANGRYFAIGEHHIVAVDAYNGCELWAQKIPSAFTRKQREPVANLASLAADDDAVYLSLVNGVTYELDAQTGKIKCVYGQRAESAPVLIESGEVERKTLATLPPHARQWGRLPQPPKKGANYPADRVNPLTGGKAPRVYKKSYGCGGVIYSATMAFFRSATIGFYDFAGDGGMRNFAGVRPSCGHPGSMVPALGLLIANEGSSGCGCAYNFQTSLALAPAAEPKNEDWAVFHDNVALGSLLRHTALNFGAPGDRRDDGGLLWLGFPRPHNDRPWLNAMAVPMHLSVHDELGAYRFNADRVTIRGSERPWIYASGYRGLTSVVADLSLYDARSSTLALPCVSSPEMDGRLVDACWGETARTPIPGRKAAVYTRYDAERLYLGFEQQAVVDRRGRAAPWAAKTQGDDAPVWEDDSFEVSLTSAGSCEFAHLGLSASGARYDGLWTHSFDVPRLDNVTVDGNPGDWEGVGFRADIPKKGRCQLGWNDQGLLLMVEHTTEVADPRYHSGMIFIVVKPGARDFLQVSADYKNLKCLSDNRIKKVKEALGIQVVGAKGSDKTYVMEALLPWAPLGIQPEPGAVVNFPMVAYNVDQLDPLFTNVPRWLTRDVLLRSSLQTCRLRLADKPAPAVSLRPAWLRHGLARAYFTVAEDAAWNAAWSGAAKTTDRAFGAEMAIPWEVLEAAGITRDGLRINFAQKGKLPELPDATQRAFAVSCHAISFSERKTSPRPYTVRLHFAEPDDVRPGQRVFDVKLQGQVVAKGLDVVAAAGGKHTALVREFKGIMADETLRLELAPKGEEITEQTSPIISGIEVAAEGGE